MSKPEYPYKAKFEVTACVVLPDEAGQKEAKASIHGLRGLFPKDVNPIEDHDLLYIAGNLAVANLCNKNGDCVTGKTTLGVYKKFEKKFINLDHDRSKIHGFILVAGLSDFDTSAIITDEDAAKIVGPFNIAIGGVLWRSVSEGKLTNWIEESQEDGEKFGQLSFSFEVGFWDYKIAVGPKDVTKATIYDRDAHSSEFLECEAMLVSNGGTGKNKKGEYVYRVIDTDVTPLGAGIVVKPAAEVEGITALTETEETTANEQETFMKDLENKIKKIVIEEFAALQEKNLKIIQETSTTLTPIEASEEDIAALQKQKEDAEVLAKLVEINQALASSTQNLTEEIKNNSQIKNNGVNPNITIMKITKAEDIVANWKEIVAHEASASEITKFIADEIAKKSEEYVAKMKEQETLAEQLRTANEAALADVTKLRAELDEIKKAQEIAANQAKFNDRMSGFDNEYDLTEEDRQVITTDIKDLSDEQFVAYQNKFKVLAKEKSKSLKQAKAAAIKETLEKSGVKATVDSSLNLSEIVASAVENKGQEQLPAGVQPTVDESLEQQMAKAFEGQISLNGKPFKK